MDRTNCSRNRPGLMEAAFGWFQSNGMGLLQKCGDEHGGPTPLCQFIRIAAASQTHFHCIAQTLAGNIILNEFTDPPLGDATAQPLRTCDNQGLRLRCTRVRTRNHDPNFRIQIPSPRPLGRNDAGSGTPVAFLTTYEEKPFLFGREIRPYRFDARELGRANSR